MNWDDLRFFLELVRLKRFKHVGRKLGVDHTTVARRIEQLEASLHCRLFESTPDGYLPTEAGQRLLAHAETIESSVGLLHEEAQGHSVQVSGTVRIGVPEGFGSGFLVPRLAPLLDEHPGLFIELLTLPRYPNLAAREADLIVTVDPPQYGRYVVSRLVDYSYGLFATRDYLASHAPISSRADLAGHRLIGFIGELTPGSQPKYLEDLLPQHQLQLSTSGMLAQLAAVQAGLGLGVLAHFLTVSTGLVAVLPQEAVWKRTYWMATQGDWYRLRRIRAVWDFIRTTAQGQQDMFLAPSLRWHRSAAGRPAP